MHVFDNRRWLDGVWEIEFETTGKMPSGPLKSFDHIAQTMAYEDMLSWSLFFTSIFDVSKSPIVDVVDPDGLVRSQSVQSEDGGFRVTLNGAETRRTLAGSFASKHLGSAVQHLALATDDIFETATVLASLGFETLPMNDNYYADLAARFTLSAESIARMKAADILYDEEDGEPFFQMYSKTTLGGFFFEIVQRGSGYNGYGAPNAPFRIAAQKASQRPKGLPSV